MSVRRNQPFCDTLLQPHSLTINVTGEARPVPHPNCRPAFVRAVGERPLVDLSLAGIPTNEGFVIRTP